MDLALFAPHSLGTEKDRAFGRFFLKIGRVEATATNYLSERTPSTYPVRGACR